MRVLLVTTSADAGPGVVGDEVRRLGHEVDVWRADEGPPPAGDHDAVIAFGGGVHPDQDDAYPWLRDVLRRLEQALQDRTPTLGICLGAQLLARAAGGAVHPAPVAEAGFVQVEPLAEDPVVALREAVLQWHAYAFDLPPGATPLAEGPAGLQAFRLRDAWGVQWHPEVDAATVRTWADRYPLAGTDPEAVKADVGTRIAAANEDGRALARRFLQAADRSI